MLAGTLLPIQDHASLVVKLSDAAESQRDSLLAEATAHLVRAYQAVDELSRFSRLPSISPTFVDACRTLCATLVSLDEVSQLIWSEP